MPDASLIWNGAFSLAPDGDLALVDGWQWTAQRLVRRLLTAPGSYITHPTYGAGLAAYIGKAVAPSKIIALVKAQIFQEASVARTPPPKIAAQILSDGISIDITYAVQPNGAPQTLSFDVTNPNAQTGQ